MFIYVALELEQSVVWKEKKDSILHFRLAALFTVIIETLRIVARQREKDEGGFGGRETECKVRIRWKDKSETGYKCVVCGVWCGKQ